MSGFDSSKHVAFCSKLEEVGAGSGQAFELFYVQCHPRLLSYLSRHFPTISIDQHEDLVQSVFLELWGKTEQVETGHLNDRYLQRMVHNAALMHIRSESRRADREQDVACDKAISSLQNETIEAAELIKLAQSHIEKLKEPRCSILRMFLFEQMPIPKISKKIGLSYENTKKHIFRGKAMIVKALRSNFE